MRIIICLNDLSDSRDGQSLIAKKVIDAVSAVEPVVVYAPKIYAENAHCYPENTVFTFDINPKFRSVSKKFLTESNVAILNSLEYSPDKPAIVLFYPLTGMLALRSKQLKGFILVGPDHFSSFFMQHFKTAWKVRDLLRACFYGVLELRLYFKTTAFFMLGFQYKSISRRLSRIAGFNIPVVAETKSPVPLHLNKMFICKSNINNQLQALKAIVGTYEGVTEVGIHLEKISDKAKLSSLPNINVVVYSDIKDYQKTLSNYGCHIFCDIVGTGQSNKVIESFIGGFIVLASRCSLRNLKLPEIFFETNILSNSSVVVKDLQYASKKASEVVALEHSYANFNSSIVEMLSLHG